MLDRIAAMPIAPMAHVYVEGRRGEVMAAFVRRERENQMRKPHIVHLTAILAAAAISLPLLVSTSSAFAASPRTTARVGTQLAGLKGHALPQASSVGSVSFAPSDRQGAVSATWTVDFTTSASGALAIGGTITINAPASTTFPSAASAYKVNGTTVTATPTTAAGTVTIDTPVAVGNSSAISVVITGVTNPAAGSYASSSFSVSTSADTVAANPASGQSFSVGSANTTTGLGLSSASVAYDSETSEIFTVTVTGQTGDGHPEGTVAVYNSTTKLCSATLIPVGGHSASVTCSLTAHELAGGSYSDVFATYSPGTPSSSNASYTYGTSSSTPVQSFSVGSANTTTSTTTSLELSAREVTYGDEQVEQLSVSVSPQHSGTTPTGTVTISGANCQITLSSGKGSCTLPVTYFNAGNRQMVATTTAVRASSGRLRGKRPSPSPRRQRRQVSSCLRRR